MFGVQYAWCIDLMHVQVCTVMVSSNRLEKLADYIRNSSWILQSQYPSVSTCPCQHYKLSQQYWGGDQHVPVSNGKQKDWPCNCEKKWTFSWLGILFGGKMIWAVRKIGSVSCVQKIKSAVIVKNHWSNISDW